MKTIKDDQGFVTYCGKWDLNDEQQTPFNWYNTDFDMSSSFWAEQLAAANDLLEEVRNDTEGYLQDLVWDMLCDMEEVVK